MKFSTFAVLSLVASLFACALASPAAEQAERTLALQSAHAGAINDDDTTHDQRRKLLDDLVGNIICDATGSCHDNYGHYGYREDRDSRRNNGYDNNGYRNNGYGRKLMSFVGRLLLQDNLVGNIICDATGSCHDNYGHYAYRQDRDQRRHNDYGRKLMTLPGRTLKDSLVGDIICDATGSCHDNYGHYGYREDRDNRRYDGGGGYDNNRGGYDNNRGGGYNNGYGK